MRVICDLHIHSRYSRATSQSMNIPEITRYAQLKGLNLVGAGDFSHPKWINELRDSLIEVSDSNLYKPTANPRTPVYYMITNEVCTIFEFEGRVRKVHHVILCPSIEVAENVSDRLARYGDLEVDGRPTLNMSAPELVEEVMSVSSNNVVFPAHCLLPDTRVHTNPQVKKIREVSKGDIVYTHRGSKRRVKEVYERPYEGRLYKIIPWYFRLGVTTTPEHPLFVIKTHKDCSWVGGYCRKSCSQKKDCGHRYYECYTPRWIQAKDLEKSDVVLYPRFNQTRDVRRIRISDYLKLGTFKIKGGLIAPKGSKVKFMDNELPVKRDFCRLVGYYLAEGYLVQSKCKIRFRFDENEKERVMDVKKLMKSIFGIDFSKTRKRNGRYGVELTYYSKILTEFFGEFCYKGKGRRSSDKQIPPWMLELPLRKQAEILKGWWRGDTGYTSSVLLMNQMKTICLRLGIIPSIGVDTVEDRKRRGKHRIEGMDITASRSNFVFSSLSFFEDRFNLLKTRIFEKFDTKMDRRHGWIDENFVYIPIRKIQTETYKGKVYNLEVEEDNSYLTEFAAVHNCWTPWFSIFGAFSGFDRFEDCYQDMTRYVFALETGLSSDPPMNWRLSSLDRFALVSNSDSHSPFPWRIGREANVFDVEKITYGEIVDAMRKKDVRRFRFTIETDPAYGKYHWTGHRRCGVSFSPGEALKLGNRCPVCRRRLTLGVEQRVEGLADRPMGFRPEGAIGYVHLLPLHEIIASVTGAGQLSSSGSWKIFNSLISRFGNEYTVLLDVPKEELMRTADSRVAEAIIRVREGRLKVIPGYDGVYGRLVISEEGAKEAFEEKGDRGEQVSLEDFM